ncbi:fucolectin-6-like [Crassostrea virginica]
MWDSYHHPGNAVNNVLVCPYGRGYLAHTRMQVDPWLEINLQSSFEIRYIVMYARQDCCEPGRTKNLELTVRENSDSHLCETYPGPTNLGDQILMTCPLLRAQYVRIQIRSQPGKTDYLQVCELQVFGKL